jgi:peptide-methionine (R)-S-oxide reductase
MKRRSLLKAIALLPTVPLLSHAPLSLAQSIASSVMPLNKPHSAWRELLTAEAYAVLFEEDTEAPGSSPLNQEKRDGTYVCAACYLPLFASQDKYESGSGWPSFTQPIAGHMSQKRDFKLIFPRTEYHCARCGGHQGHVFNDGPKPRGERWCNNGLALSFIPKGESLPELRS